MCNCFFHLLPLRNIHSHTADLPIVTFSYLTSQLQQRLATQYLSHFPHSFSTSEKRAALNLLQLFLSNMLRGLQNTQFCPYILWKHKFLIPPNV